ncbi:MAG: hypothetical protein ACREKM_05980 [Longimicrobiales bacterium]
MGARLLTGGVLAVIGLITVKLVMGLFGVLAGLFSFLFFTVLPIVLIGWIVLKVVGKLRDKPAYD